MTWTIEFHPKAKEEVAELPKSLRSKLRTLLDDIEADGFNILPPKSVKNIEDGIMEFRVRGQDGIARSLFVTAVGKRIDILLAFVKKTEKTPRRYIELAKKRRSEVKNEDDTLGRS